jgi:cyclomaltodextrinase / maltogenic alpha-amylase / neopullulanase
LFGDPYQWEDGKWTYKSTPMTLTGTDSLFDYWIAEITPEFKRLRYGFVLNDDTTETFFGEKGFSQEPSSDVADYFCFPFLNTADVFLAPQWVKNTIWYQIFPERFANGDSSNDPDGSLAWGSNKPTPNNFFGGDLEGVIENISDLKDLGVNGIYFTPIFKAFSNHKYDTIDYLELDPAFGDKETFKRLIKTCHDHDIKVMLDAVFNHSGFYFPPFQDVVEHGQNSKYKDWFHIHAFPLKTEPAPNYDTFAFTPFMPKLNTENNEGKEYLLNVARYWVEEFDIDGWRLDVANEIDHQFWREFRQVVKTIKPDLYILGEIWHDSMPWLRGDQFDAVMNYPFTTNLLNLFAKQSISSKQFVENMTNVLHMYPKNINDTAFNLVGSHDTPRVLNECNQDENRARLIFTFLLTFIGTPCIYYGDEIGMSGGQDPGCRKCMEWDVEKQNRDLFTHIQTLISIRKKEPLLANEGTLSFLPPELHSNCIAFTKSDGKQTILVLLNSSEQDINYTLPFDLKGKTIKNLFTSKEFAADIDEIDVKLKPLDFTILKF